MRRHRPNSLALRPPDMCKIVKTRQKKKGKEKRDTKYTILMIHSVRVKSLSLVEVIVYLGGVPIAVPGDEEVLAIGLVVDVAVACLVTVCCCLIFRRRPSSLPRVPSITE